MARWTQETWPHLVLPDPVLVSGWWSHSFPTSEPRVLWGGRFLVTKQVSLAGWEMVEWWDIRSVVHWDLAEY